MNIQALRAQIVALDAALLTLHQSEDGELRTLTTDEQTEFDTKWAEREALQVTLKRHEAIQAAALDPARVEAPDAPQVVVKPEPMAVLEDRSSSPRQLADAATRLLEAKPDNVAENMAYARTLLVRHSRDNEWIRSMLLRSTDLYAEAWGTVFAGREMSLTNEERTVLGVTTNANGKFLLPTHLDPTVMLTNVGSSNVIRSLARVVTLTGGAATWNGVSSAGVTASWDGEVVEVSDDSPTFAQPSIGTVRAQALVQASISATEDIAGLSGEVLNMFADARDRLEGAAHATGAGTTEPKGVFTAVHAVTASRVTSTTAATIGLVDIHAVYNGLPVRWRGKGTWLMNPVYALAVKTLGTAVSASFSGDLTQPTAGRILGHNVVESDDAPTTQTTTALDDEILFGDFDDFIIVDRPGSMLIEHIPHLFNTANNLPDGRRAWYATWRNGSDVGATANAFRVLVDKTSA